MSSEANKKKVRIGLVQMAASKDPEDNLRRALEKTRMAARKGAQIICLQELYRSLYFPQAERDKAAHLAETIPGPSTEAFSRLAKTQGVVVIVPLFEKAADGRFYNSAAVLNEEGKLLPVYRKIHIPQDPLFYEKNYFEAGDRGFQVYKTRHASFAVLICYDQWFPEAARIGTLHGADILFYPTAIGRIKGYRPPEGDWREAWITIQRSHAIANGSHVAAVNRVGKEGELEFWGSSFVCDAFGNILKQASRSREETLVVDADLSQNEKVRKEWGFLRNRRPDSYAPLVGALK